MALQIFRPKRVSKLQVYSKDRQIAAIRSWGGALTVVGTAASPPLLGAVLDAGQGFGLFIRAAVLCALLFCIAALAHFWRGIPRKRPHASVERELETGKDLAVPVSFETSIGRLSRMDALQGQQMALECKARRRQRL